MCGGMTDLQASFYKLLNKIFFFFLISLLLLGHDTKALMNNSGPRYKRSKVERDLNKDVVACVIILFILCFLGGVGK